MNGMLTVTEFAEKIGSTKATVHNWILLNKIPFKLSEKGTRLIPEFEAMEAPCVKTFVPRDYATRVIQIPNPSLNAYTPPRPEKVAEPIVTLKSDLERDERLFLIARQQAQGFIARAKNCRLYKKHEAEAELLWMAVECFGFKP